MLLRQPRIVGIGGTTSPGSSTELLLAGALEQVRERGAQCELFAGGDIELPLYPVASAERVPAAQRLVASLRAADGVIIATPAYHGAVSGLVKNALDYIEDLRTDDRVYLDGRAVGCIVTSHGWQSANSTLVTLRTIAHALRGWPTPLGVAVNLADAGVDEAGVCTDAAVREQIALLAAQVWEFAALRIGRHDAQAGDVSDGTQGK